MIIGKKILIRFDDICENMNWDFMNRCEVIFDKYNIKPLLGVIPSNLDNDLKTWPKKDNFWDMVRAWQNKGWEISMHGYNHLYNKETHGHDYFGYGGKTEFYGENYEIQKTKILKGIKKFNDENIQIRSFFAPSHTYDINTFRCLHELGIKYVIDGYGLFPYYQHKLIFIPQLFYNLIFFPFGVQSTQIHLNMWSEKDMKKFENFIIKNKKNIFSFNEIISYTTKNKRVFIINNLLKIALKSMRSLKNKKNFTY